MKHRGISLWLSILVIAGCRQDAPGAEQNTLKNIEPSVKALPVDERTAINVDAATRQAVLVEMRTMLAAVQGIVGGVAAWDTAAIRSAAHSGGVAAASEADPAVEAQLGHEFVQLGMRTHMAFDSLAIDAARTKDRDVVLRRLAAVMGNCVGCHTQWRLVVRE
jgi:cytochrome c556